jgi:hypothetical protein
MSVNRNELKRAYEQPTFVRLGAFSSLTNAMQMGPYADMVFELMMMSGQ